MSLSTVGAVTDEFPAPASGDWTLDDLSRLPDDGRRFEIIDGTLLVSPPPHIGHQAQVIWFRRALEARLPAERTIFENVAVRLGQGARERLVIPDLTVAVGSVETVLDRGITGPAFLTPPEVALVVEVVSPSSRRADRVTKPRLYAQAGIVHYWRVEQDRRGATVHVHRRSEGRYEELAQVGPGDVLTLAEPWPVTIQPR